MPSFNTAIIDEPIAIDERLADFGLVVSQFLAIRDSARAATDDASPLMPLNAPGTLGYIHGVEALRGQILDGTWQIDRTLGVEAIINREIGVRIGYQNVDKACDPVFKPMPRTAKGPASEKMCGVPLFDYYDMELETDADRLPSESVKDPLADQITTYFVMVGEDGSVELSCPIIKNHRYADFVERIFIETPDVDWEEKIDGEDGPLDDFDVDVSFKDVQ
jgi:hypothetical protein